MTWNPRRKGWIARTSTPIVIESARLELDVVVVPPYPCFSPSSIAGLLHKNRSTVAYWMHAGKLSFFRDNIGEPYILRDELVRFVREYLQMPTQ